ncbi:hypothetical protein Bbelb_313030 [Branchiostoma belcheri]|nr:hypothetical protein Bbelb_313030 [Branchiostoma belcheri]
MHATAHGQTWRADHTLTPCSTVRVTCVDATPSPPSETSCGSTLFGEGGYGYFTSPNFPNKYGNNLTCEWTILVNSSKFIVVDFLKFDVEPHPKCDYDFVLVSEGNFKYSRDLECHTIPEELGFCKGSIPYNQMFLPNLVGHTNYSEIVTSSAYTTAQGLLGNQDGCRHPEVIAFHCALLAPMCNGNRMVPMCYSWWREVMWACWFVSDFYDVNPLPWTDCYYPHQKEDCFNGWGENYRGSQNTTDDANIAKWNLDGNYCRNPYRSRKGPWCYVMDTYKPRKQSCDVPSCGSKASGTSSCGSTLTGDEGRFSTPNYPGSYDSNLWCTWTIIVNASESITVTFDSFDVEFQQNCDYDYVQLYEGSPENNRTLEGGGKFCGSSSTQITYPKYRIVSKLSTVMVVFHTDAWVTSSGFNASYAATEKECREIPGQLGFCKGIIAYEEMSLPNLLGHTDVSEIVTSDAFNTTLELLDNPAGCFHRELTAFHCAILAPKCVKDRMFPMCYSWWREVMWDCWLTSDIYDVNPLPWHGCYYPPQTEDCHNGWGENYRGLRNRTATGEVCLDWKESEQNWVTQEVIDKWNLDGNYCRNPARQYSEPWCYVTDRQNKPRARLCSVPACGRNEWSEYSVCEDSLTNGTLVFSAAKSGNRKCRWVISVEQHMKINLTFHHISINKERWRPDCPYDHIEVFDGEHPEGLHNFSAGDITCSIWAKTMAKRQSIFFGISIQKSTPGKFCGGVQPVTIISESYKMSILFTSEGFGELLIKYFNATFSDIPRDSSLLSKSSSPFAHGLVPVHLQSLIPSTRGEWRTTRLQLRNTTHLHVPRCRTKVYRSSFIPHASTLWNRLPQALKEASSLNDFKRKCKDYLFTPRHNQPYRRLEKPRDKSHWVSLLRKTRVTGRKLKNTPLSVKVVATVDLRRVLGIVGLVHEGDPSHRWVSACEAIPSVVEERRVCPRSFTKTAFPNFLRHNNASELEEAGNLEDASALKGSSCHDQIREFTCYNLLPECLSDELTRHPCRSWCAEVRAACTDEPLMEIIPPCKHFPDDNCEYGDVNDECYHGNGRNYRGKKNITVSDKVCVAWHLSAYQGERYKWLNLEENYCRNPDGALRPWCYTDKARNWEYCDLIPCSKTKVAFCDDRVRSRSVRVRPIRPRYWPGETVTYMCETGYTLSGASMAECNQDGVWDVAPPECIENKRTQLLIDKFNRSVYSADLPPTDTGVHITLAGAINAVISLHWNDPRLSWTPSSYDDLESMTLPHIKVWTPLMSLAGSADKDFAGLPEVDVTVNHDGEVIWAFGKRRPQNTIFYYNDVGSFGVTVECSAQIQEVPGSNPARCH